MFKTLINVFRVPELRNKVLFTLFMLAIYRIGYQVPLPGVDQDKFAEMVNPNLKDIQAAERQLTAAKAARSAAPAGSTDAIAAEAAVVEAEERLHAMLRERHTTGQPAGSR